MQEVIKYNRVNTQKDAHRESTGESRVLERADDKIDKTQI